MVQLGPSPDRSLRLKLSEKSTPAGGGGGGGGIPASLPASGAPASGVPASGVPASGTPASGVPASGTPPSDPPPPPPPVPSAVSLKSSTQFPETRLVMPAKPAAVIAAELPSLT